MMSTRDLTQFPAPDALRRMMQAFAMIDAILEEDDAYRYYKFNAQWSPTEQMGSMSNGAGDDLFAVFDAAGCFVRGFDHESVMSPWAHDEQRVWPGVLDQVPPQFAASLNEPAFSMDAVTFCMWHAAGEGGWQRGAVDFPAEDDPDGSAWMLSAYDGDPATHQQFIEGYHEVEVSQDAIARVLSHEPLSRELLAAFRADRSLEEVIGAAQEIGYPVAR